MVKSLVLTLSCICALSTLALAAVPTSEFDRLDRMRTASVTDLRPIEVQYLELASRYTEPEDLGNIYYHLVEDVYFQSGVSDPASAIKYATKALEYPLSDSQHVQMEHVIGIAIKRQNVRKNGEVPAAARSEIVRPLLEAVKYCLDHKIPAAKLPRVEDPFPFGRHNPNTSGPWLSDEENRKREKVWEEKKRQQNAEQKEYEDALQKREGVNKCVEIRIGCEDLVVSVYAKKPYDTDELRRIAMEIVQDEKAVDALVAKVNAAVQKQEAETTAGQTAPDTPAERAAPVTPAPVGILEPTLVPAPLPPL